MREFTIVVILVTAVATFCSTVAGHEPISNTRAACSDAIRAGVREQILMLDGLKCTKCSFKNLTLVYSGGQYELKDATFSGTIVVELHGAAENGLLTVSTLSFANPEPRKTMTFDQPRTMSLKNMW